MNTNEHKARAAKLGLEWSAVLAIYREARELERAEVERVADDRQSAVSAAFGDVHAGRFKIANRRAFTIGDATNVRGLDVVAADRGLTADELFAALAADAPGLRPADEVMAAAIDRAAALAGPADEPTDMIGLVAGAIAADVTEQWLRRLVRSGAIRGRKAGRNWIVSRSDCESFRRHPTAGRPRLQPF